MESPGECGIEPPGSISHGVSYYLIGIMTGTPTEKIPLGRSRLRWEDNNRVDLQEIGVNTRNCVNSTQDRDYGRDLVNAVLDFQVP